MTYTLEVVNGRPVYIDLDAAGNVVKAPPPVLPTGPGLDYPPGLGPTIGLVQGMTDGSEVVRPLAQFNNPGGFVDDAGIVADALQRTNVVRLVPGGQYTGLSTVNLLPGQWIVCPGPAGQAGAVVWNFKGTGDAFRQTWPGAYSGLTTVGGGINGLTVDLAGATGTFTGIHGGDIESLCYHGTFIRNAVGSGGAAGTCMGYHFDNTRTQTERLYGELRTANCDSHYVFDVNGGSISFARPNLLMRYTGSTVAQKGVTLLAGAIVYDSDRFAISGNHGSSASGTPGAVLSLTGSNAGQGSRIVDSALMIGVETNIGAVSPQTINFGAAGNVIANTYGLLDFSLGAGTFAPSNLAASGATFRHDGSIDGDPSLVRTLYHGTVVVAGFATGGQISPALGGNQSVNPAAPATGCKIATTTRDGQDLTIINLSANLVTFAAPGVSNVAAGTGATVPAFGRRDFKWNAANALWYGGVS